jgi:phosphoglycolate phosphatase
MEGGAFHVFIHEGEQMDKLVIFDYDGTIADSSSYAYDIYMTLMKRLGKPVMSAEAFDALRKKPMRARIKQAGIPVWRVPKLIRMTKEIQRSFAAQTHPYDGMIALLKDLRTRAGLSIVSSNAPSNIHTFLKTQGIDFFDDIIGNRGIHGKAPALRRLCQKHGLRPSDVLYVADEIRDIRAARKAGIRIIAVSWGYDHHELLLSEQADGIAHNAQELGALVRKHLDL